MPGAQKEPWELFTSQKCLLFSSVACSEHPKSTALKNREVYSSEMLNKLWARFILRHIKKLGNDLIYRCWRGILNDIAY